MRLEIAPACHVVAPPGDVAPCHSAWLEGALRLRATVVPWHFREEAWSHWAAPLGGDGASWGAPRRFDPGRFALAPGRPDGATAPDPALGEQAAAAFVELVIGQWRPVLHRQPELALVSRLDEPLEEFRRRCRSALRPLLTAGPADPAELATESARLSAAIESISLGGEEIIVLHGRIGVVWYPVGREPAAASPELMLAGAARGGR
jgi:hypothetical protein